RSAPRSPGSSTTCSASRGRSEGVASAPPVFSQIDRVELPVVAAGEEPDAVGAGEEGVGDEGAFEGAAEERDGGERAGGEPAQGREPGDETKGGERVGAGGDEQAGVEVHARDQPQALVDRLGDDGRDGEGEPERETEGEEEPAEAPVRAAREEHRRAAAARLE